MDLQDLLDALNAGETITGGSPLHEVMHRVSQDALRVTAELNGGYQEPERVRAQEQQVRAQVLPLRELQGQPAQPQAPLLRPPQQLQRMLFRSQ